MLRQLSCFLSRGMCRSELPVSNYYSSLVYSYFSCVLSIVFFYYDYNSFILHFLSHLLLSSLVFSSLLFYPLLFSCLLLSSHLFSSILFFSYIVRPANMWSCPHHTGCVACGKSSSAVGFLFRCTMCPNAHCEDCRGGDQEVSVVCI